MNRQLPGVTVPLLVAALLAGAFAAGVWAGLSQHSVLAEVPIQAAPEVPGAVQQRAIETARFHPRIATVLRQVSEEQIRGIVVGVANQPGTLTTQLDGIYVQFDFTTPQRVRAQWLDRAGRSYTATFRNVGGIWAAFRLPDYELRWFEPTPFPAYEPEDPTELPDYVHEPERARVVSIVQESTWLEELLAGQEYRITGIWWWRPGKAALVDLTLSRPVVAPLDSPVVEPWGTGEAPWPPTVTTFRGWLQATDPSELARIEAEGGITFESGLTLLVDLEREDAYLFTGSGV